MPGTLTVAGIAAGLQTGEKIIGPITKVGSATVSDVRNVSLLSGDNTVTVPLGATAALIVLPAGNATAVKVRTNLNASDTGLPVAPTDYCVLTLAAGVTSLILNAGGSISNVELSFI